MRQYKKDNYDLIYSFHGKNKWKLLGPGGGGAQYFPAISPHNADIILVACDMTGAYITVDGGLTWSEFNLRSVVCCFAFDPGNSGVIYAGGSGLYRSEDRGKSWRLIFPNPGCVTEERMYGDHADHSFISGDNWPGGTVQCIRVNEFDNSKLYIGIYTGKKLLIYFSKDYGKNWTGLLEMKGKKLHAIYLEHLPNNEVIYCFSDKEAYTVCTGVKPCSAGIKLPENIDYVTSAAWGRIPETGLPVFYLTSCRTKPGKAMYSTAWKSEDMGFSWQEIKANAMNLPQESTCIEGECLLAAACENDGRCIYAGIHGCEEVQQESGAGSVNSCFGVIKSMDGGNTWSWVLKSDYASNAANLDAGWAERDYGLPWFLTGPKGVGPIGLAVSPVNKDLCCTTDLSSTFFTTDGGIRWKQLYSTDNLDGSVSSRGLEVTTCYGIHFDPFDSSHIAVSYTDIGFMHTKNGGRSWFHSIGNLPVSWGNTCYWVVFDPEVKGRSWSAWGGAHDLPRPKMLRSGKFHKYEGGICKSNDNMDTWQISNSGMPGNCVVTHIALDPLSSPERRTLYAAAFDKGVYKSTDDGAAWTLKNNGIHGNLNAWRVEILPDGSLYLLVARGLRNKKVVDGALYRSSDGGESWEKLALPDGANAPNDLVYDPYNPKIMYLSCWPVETDGNGVCGGLYETSDGGESWNNIFDQSSHVYAAAVHPGDSSKLFIVTFDSAAYYTEDKGKTWFPVKGYDFKWGHRPVVDPLNNDMLYITTFGSSVWYGPWKDAN